MKKIIYLMALTAAFVTCNLCGIQGENSNNIDVNKVNKFIEEVGKFAKENPDIFEWKNKDTSRLKSVMSLTEDEFLEVQKIIAKEVPDLKYYLQGNFPEGKKFSNENHVKSLIFYAAFSYPMREWTKTMSNEEIIMNKISPVIEDGTLDDVLKSQWLYKLDDVLRDIHNRKQAFASKNREAIMNALITIIHNGNKSVDLRIAATTAWISGEKREHVKYEIVSALMKNDEMFAEIGKYIHFLDTYDSPAPLIYESMINVLENRDKYSHDVVAGALSFFEFGGMSSWDNKIEIKPRLEKALQKMSKDKASPELQRRVDKLLERTKTK